MHVCIRKMMTDVFEYMTNDLFYYMQIPSQVTLRTLHTYIRST